MKPVIAYSLSIALSLSIVPLAGAQAQGMGSMDMAKKDASGATHKGTGVVRKSDIASGKVTIAHDPVKSMEWPSMTMSFTAKDKKLLEGIKPGAKVEFEFVQQGSKYTITSIKQ